MCNLHEKLEKDEFLGYKVVCEDDQGRHYSPAMGICYEDYDIMPETVQQERLTEYFHKNILESNLNGFSFDMKGRTSVYTWLDAARSLYHSIIAYRPPYPAPWSRADILPPFINYTLHVRKAVVYMDLMAGYYGSDPVVAGRKIRFLSEVV